MTLDGWRRTLQSHDFHDASLAMQLASDVFAHDASHLVVVGTDEGSKLLRAGLTLKDDNGDSFVISPINGWRDGLHLVGGNDEQVDATGHQRVNLFYLAFIAIIGSSKTQLHVVLTIGCHTQLGILFLAPDIC